MGTSMSAYIEWDESLDEPPFSDPDLVLCFTEGSFSFNKEYRVFDALAGGRNDAYAPENQDPRSTPLIAPRGMPSPCSMAVAWDYYRLIAEPSNLPDKYFWPEWLCVSPEQATVLSRNKACHRAEILQSFNCKPPGKRWRAISAPAHYNASWMWLEEYDAALEHHGLILQELPVVYRIIREALSQLVQQYGQSRVRLVVWFS